MGKPDKLRIALDEGRFENVGRLPNGIQFLAYVTGAFPGELPYPDSSSDWRHKKRWLAVMHLFDAEGAHLSSDIRLGGLDIEGRDIAGGKAWERLEEMYEELCRQGTPEFCDIWVTLFSVEADGVRHGLIYERDEDDSTQEWVMLQPCDIMFHPPWDSSEYST